MVYELNKGSLYRGDFRIVQDALSMLLPSNPNYLINPNATATCFCARPQWVACLRHWCSGVLLAVAGQQPNIKFCLYFFILSPQVTLGIHQRIFFLLRTSTFCLHCRNRAHSRRWLRQTRREVATSKMFMLRNGMSKPLSTPRQP